jgi:cytochrome b pre-mRNA-processing protein 3
MFKLFRKDPRQPLIEALYRRIVAAARSPELYARLGVPDSVEGRFEALILHVVLVLRRLRQLPAPAADIGQDLVNQVFLELDRALREMGVGDFGVPKRMKKLGAAFYGRAQAYDAALDAGDRAALAQALGRNLLGGAEPPAALVTYAWNAAHELDELTLDALLAEGPSFPVLERSG